MHRTSGDLHWMFPNLVENGGCVPCYTPPPATPSPFNTHAHSSLTRAQPCIPTVSPRGGPMHTCAFTLRLLAYRLGRDALFWQEFESVGFKNESMVQNALIVASINPNAVLSNPGGAVFAPQNEFWIAGPLTIVNYKDIGALRGCASVRTREQTSQRGVGKSCGGGGASVAFVALRAIRPTAWVPCALECTSDIVVLRLIAVWELRSATAGRVHHAVAGSDFCQYPAASQVDHAVQANLLGHGWHPDWWVPWCATYGDG